MTSPGRSDLGVIDGETFDFSQLEEYINDDSENNIYFPDTLVTSSDLKLNDVNEKAFGRGLQKDPAVESTEGHGQGLNGRCTVQLPGDNTGHSPNKAFALHHPRAGEVSSSYNKPHRLPDSPPDSGSEPPFSPPIEDPKVKCSPVDLLPHHPELSAEGLKYMGYGHLMHLRPPSSTSPTSHHRQHAPDSPVPVHSTHSASMPVLSPLQMPSFNPLQQQLMAPGTHLSHLYTGSEDFLYDNLANPVSSTTNSKKRKLPDSPKMPRNHQNNCVQVKVEPSGSLASPDPLVLPSGGEDEYGLEMSDSNGGMFVDSSFQCIRFQPFQQNTWGQLLDKDMNEIGPPHYRVDADKGFNFSNADESFVCQKKNHFQVTVHVQPAAEARYVRTPDHGTRPIERFALHFQGVKMESPTQTIKVEQSQSDRSKRPFHPVPLELLVDQVTKTTVGRLHFSETTSNNMRKKGKPNPDQRFFFLVVSLCAHTPGGDVPPATIVAHASEKIIVRASNPGQFENDMELSWQKGSTPDSIFHNGRVGINTDRPEESLVVHGNIKVTGHILQPSDLRAKCDIHELDTREQLRNVANLRIVRYRYLPGVCEGDQDTGVIAQEVRHVIPEAVLQAGDMVLKDGRLIEKLLVVNKERIFMENVGAVKELCKVTDNLETRIDELERINKKLTSIRRKDSLKSTSTDLSRVSSVLSHGKKRCHRTCSKRHREVQPSCSSHFIQSSIIVLVVIMFCCLIFLATLNIMEWQRRRGSTHVRISLPIQTKSSSEYATPNSTFRASTLSPSIVSPGKSSIEASRSTAGPSPKRSTKFPFPVPQEDDPLLGHDPECTEGECPIFCCGGAHHDWQDLGGRLDDNSVHFQVQKKSGVPIDHTFPPKLGLKESSIKGLQEKPHKITKRNVDPDDEETENSQIFKTDDHSYLELHLLELNATLLPELCSEERFPESSAVFIFCNVYISRHFPRPNITLQVRSDDNEMVVQYCSGQHYMSCPHEVLQEEKPHTINKRRVGLQSRSFQLSVGSFLASRYRFRMMSQRLNTDQQICSLGPNFQPFVEYVITFQRRCDK